MASFINTTTFIPFTSIAYNPATCQILKNLDAISVKEIREYRREHRKVNIEYSRNYKATQEFQNISDLFDQHHNVNIINKLIKSNSPQLSFFKDLDKTLTKIRCTDQGKKKYFTNAHQHITKSMIKSINKEKLKGKYKLLPNITELKATKQIPKGYLDNKSLDKLKDAEFRVRFNFDYDEWMKAKIKYENMFKNEISKALDIDPSLIEISNVSKGSVVVDWYVANIWIPIRVANLPTNPIPRHYIMRSQDQIKVKYNGKWHKATIVHVDDSPSHDGVKFKVRYNPDPVTGKDKFWTNTEWFLSSRQADRLRVPNQVYARIDQNGANVQCRFIPDPIASNGFMINPQTTDHIFVNGKQSWYRCEVIKVTNNARGTEITVKNLVTGDTRNLSLWQNSDQLKISLKDERYPNG